MYTIKEASARTGVGAPLIRAWERRYGVVTPTRTASGYRLYDDATLGVLVTMRTLVESGWTASEAARAITAGEVTVTAEAVEPREPADASTNRARLIARFVAAAESTSPTETEAALDAMLIAGSFEAVVDDLLLPATAALGDAWMAGRLSVAAEHAASAAVARRLGAVYQAAGVPTRPSVVVGLPPGSRHELGAFAFAATLRRRGVGVLYVGADVTVEGWIDAVGRTHARAAVSGSSCRPTARPPRPWSRRCGPTRSRSSRSAAPRPDRSWRPCTGSCSCRGASSRRQGSSPRQSVGATHRRPAERRRTRSGCRRGVRLPGQPHHLVPEAPPIGRRQPGRRGFDRTAGVGDRGRAARWSRPGRDGRPARRSCRRPRPASEAAGASSGGRRAATRRGPACRPSRGASRRTTRRSRRAGAPIRA